MAHVRKEGKSWYYAIDMGKDLDGKRKIKKKRGFKTKKEAETAMNIIINEINTGRYVEPSQMLYGTFMEDWLDYKEHTANVKKTTLDAYTRLTRVHIIPGLGNRKISELNQFEVDYFLRDLTKSGRLASESVQKIYTMIKDSLGRAVKLGLIASNVCDFVDRPTATKKDLQIWDVDEVVKFLDTAKKDRSYMVFYLAITCGMRQSEILGLTWDNVDLKNGTIYVKKQLERNTREFTTLKTKSSKRSISINENDVQALKEQRKLIASEQLHSTHYTNMNLVCPTSTGTPYLFGNIRKIFNRLIKEAGVKPIRFHDQRHTHVSLLLKSNVNPKIIAERLGHANTRTTLDIYSHLLPNIQKDTAKLFGDMLFGANREIN
ncbi:site-specific integrase [Metabacillus sp. cB07]|uniref:site-specific integrase n=1 Tax=Metabacillus sp. cB07 TaxID=2806989 RepID=UPI0019394820|nr:site-specific integrase [Metabacillus sp. cB07]